VIKRKKTNVSVHVQSGANLSWKTIAYLFVWVGLLERKNMQKWQ